ncbi:unnamed protein product, partial [marine sediment metagenome]
MPRESVALFVRPNFDMATEYGYYYLGQAAVYASQNMSVVDLPGGDATRSNIFSALAE